MITLMFSYESNLLISNFATFTRAISTHNTTHAIANA